MEIDSTTLLLHGSYVAFVFALVLFAALGFRQLSDNLAVRRLKMGEDRIGFISAPGVVVSLSGLVLSGSLGFYLWLYPVPRIYFYALPLILIVQFTQVLIRVYMQRTLVKTRGFVFRSIAFDSIRGIPFERIVRADVQRFAVWTKVTLLVVDDKFGHVTFRIFPFSEAALIRILEGWCACEIRRSGTSLHK